MRGTYLGPQLDWHGHNGIEIQRRVSAATAAFYAFRRLWHSCIPLKFKALAFRSVVVSVLLSGLISLAITPAEYHKLSTCLYKLLRKLLGGKACQKGEHEGDKTCKSLSNRAVNSLVGIASPLTELRVERLKFFQGVVAEPHLHELYLTAVFGHFSFEDKKLDHTRAGLTHDWTTQLIADIDALDVIEDAQYLVSEYQGEPLRVIMCHELREQFCKVDVGQLRAGELRNEQAHDSTR